MPTLSNSRWERFCQEICEGKTADKAYEIAGFERNRKNAARLKATEVIRARIAEILTERGERIELTKDAIVGELQKIGFADIRNAVNWRSNATVAAIDNDADTQALVEEGEIRFAITNQVEMISSDDIDDDTAAAISEVSMTDKGSIKIKLHDKRAALVDIAKIMGWHSERVEHSGRDGAPIEVHSLSDEEAARRIAFTLSKADRT